MKLYRKITLVVFCVISIALIVSFKYPTKAKVTIQFKSYVGDAVLQLDSTYKNQLGQDFKVSNFKYYVGNIVLKNANGKNYITKDYFLINENEEETKQVNLNEVPEGSYSGIEFIIGVDSIHNCSGLQTGTLDPTKGMFWAWNTGYIFLKLDGQSPVSKSAGNMFEYHIGGFKQPTNCIRKITLNFKSNKTISASTPLYLNIKADVLEIFKTPTAIDFSKLSSVTDLHNAETIANNYADMFSLLEK